MKELEVLQRRFEAEAQQYPGVGNVVLVLNRFASKGELPVLPYDKRLGEYRYSEDEAGHEFEQGFVFMNADNFLDLLKDPKKSHSSITHWFIKNSSKEYNLKEAIDTIETLSFHAGSVVESLPLHIKHKTDSISGKLASIPMRKYLWLSLLHWQKDLVSDKEFEMGILGASPDSERPSVEFYPIEEPLHLTLIIIPLMLRLHTAREGVKIFYPYEKTQQKP